LDTLIAGIVTVAAFASYFVNSFHHVPLTLLGILIFHTMLLLFGFGNAGASALTAILVILLAQGISYNELRPAAQNVGSNRQNANA
jgi:Na+/H+-dicarboxylate symporter